MWDFYFIICYKNGGDRLKDRIRQIRKLNKMNQTEFGAKIGVKGNTIGNYELGLRNPSDAVILSICREFNINEEWLRNGTKPMKKNDGDISEYLNNFISESNPFYDIIKGIIKTYVNLDEKSQKTIQHFSEELLKELHITSNDEYAEKIFEAASIEKPKTINFIDTSIDEQVELYRKELEYEEKVEEKSKVLLKDA